MTFVKPFWIAMTLLSASLIPPVTARGIIVFRQEATAEFSPADIEFFESKVRPLLLENCLDCHSGEEPSANLRLDHRKGILRGGDTGPAAVPGDVDGSLLIQAVHYDGVYQMPPDSKLSREKVETLEEWVRRGLPWPDEPVPGEGAEIDPGLQWKERESHWVWKSPQRRAIPVVDDPGWISTPVDRFLKSKMDSAGLQPAGLADRATLLRRASWMLTGILPTPEEISAFENDSSANAFERQVDRLIASPRFGERFARHWMDLTRYAETCGHEFDYPLPHAWQYRDYLIRAFNADVPYDQFVREHIAGDLVAEPRVHPERLFNESIIGTGFWFLGEATHGPVDVKGDEAGRIDNQIDVMCKTFLGMTVACARCHDHKFDAIKATDYYALSGLLQSSRRQDAMLDMDGKIAAAIAGLKETRTTIESLDREFLLTDIDRDLFAERLTELAQLQKALASTSVIRMEGESLSFSPPTSGVVEPQEIDPSGRLAWSGNRQLWWRNAEIGATLEIDLPANVPAGKFLLKMNLTKAVDYGVLSISIADQPIVESLDCFSTELKNETVEFGEVSFGESPRKLRLTILQPNPAAQPSNMFGIDWIELTPSAATAEAAALTESIAQKWNCDREQLLQLARSEPELASLIRPVEDHHPGGAEPSVLFHDFSSGEEGWFTLGIGDHLPVSNRPRHTLDGDIIPAGVYSTRTLDKRIEQTLTSPTFEITHPAVHVLLRGNDIRLRVIVDGFVLDTANPLLFAGMTFDIPPDEGFRWITISGDLRNYIGHRAHLEIIDNGTGYADVAAVFFGDLNPPVEFFQPAGKSGDRSAVNIRELVQLIVDLRDEDLVDSGTFSERVRQAGLMEWLLRVPQRTLFGDTKLQHLASRSMALSQLPEIPRPVRVLAMADGTPEDEYLFVRGNHRNLASKVPRGSLSTLRGSPCSADWDRVNGSGRMEFAAELTHPEHPLVSRVIVNRLWHHLFGRGIVTSTDNFGIMGNPPTHPELLDWLAIDFSDHGWSLKRMVKNLVMTRAWQLSDDASGEMAARDPQNLLYGRVEPKRMDGESIRDSMLAMSGRLDSGMFGPPVRVYLTEFMQGRGRPGTSGPLDGAGRRSIYLEVRRNFLNPMMLAFDTPIPFNATGNRNVSNVPAQSLIMMNDPLVHELSTKFAAKLIADAENENDRLEQLFLHTTGRRPDEQEIGDCLAAVSQWQVDEGDDEQGAWAALCHVMWNSKAFLFVW